MQTISLSIYLSVVQTETVFVRILYAKTLSGLQGREGKLGKASRVRIGIEIGIGIGWNRNRNRNRIERKGDFCHFSKNDGWSVSVVD